MTEKMNRLVADWLAAQYVDVKSEQYASLVWAGYVCLSWRYGYG